MTDIENIIKDAKIINSTGETIDNNTLTNKIIGLYFSASWCGPCKAFTPKLVKFYNLIKDKKDDFEIIFVSLDRDEESYNTYREKMPFPVICHTDKESVSKLKDIVELRGIPTFIVINKDRELINSKSDVIEYLDNETKELVWLN